MREMIERYLLELIRRSTPEKTAWNVEKIREGAEIKWNYIDGCMLTALLTMTEITGDDRFAAFAEQVGDSFVREDGSIRTFSPEKHALDDYNESRILFPLARRTGKDKYRKAAEQQYRYLMEQPRTWEGNFWHKEIYPDQVWLDGTYMALPFLAMYQREMGSGDYSDIIGQLRTVRKRMRDPETGLYYHGYDASRKAFWADPDTGLSRNFWLRADGWFACAMADLAEIIPPEKPEQAEIAGMLADLTDSVSRYTDPETGMYMQVIDQGNREGNYPETSGSAMMAYAMLKGARLGVLDPKYREMGRKTFTGITEGFMALRDGMPELTNICLVAGLGPENNRRRDGSYEYYISEPVVANDAKGAAPYVLAYTEIRRISEQ